MDSVVNIIKKYWYLFAGGIGAYVLYSATRGGSSDPLGALVAQNTAMALTAQANESSARDLEMQLNAALNMAALEADSKLQALQMSTEAAMYMHNVDVNLHQTEYAEALVASQNLAAMEIKGKVASGVSSSIAEIAKALIGAVSSAATTANTNQSSVDKTVASTSADRMKTSTGAIASLMEVASSLFG